MKIWDISRTLSDDLAPWPGDTPFHFELTARLGEGAAVNVGAIRMSTHNGSHVDARFHFEKNGTTIDQSAVEIYLGTAAVVDLTQHFANNDQALITVDPLCPSVDQLRQTSRLLIKTGV